MNNENNKSNNYIPYMVIAIGGAITYWFLYLFAYRYIAGNHSDLGAHMSFVYDFIENGSAGFFKSWARVPYCVWHLLIIAVYKVSRIPLDTSGAFVYALFGVFAYLITIFLIDRVVLYYNKVSNLTLAAIGSFLLSCVGPLFTVWNLPLGKYLGQFSVNPYHNPTQMAVKGIGMICVMLGIDIFRQYREEKPMFFFSKQIQNHLYLWFSIMLFLSTITKPTFMYMLLPAGFIFIIIDLVSSKLSKKISTKNVLKAFGKLCIAVIPSMIFLLLEFLAFYYWSGKGNASHIALSKPLTVWHFFSFNVPYSILLGMLLPIWMCITDPKHFIKAVEARFAVICYFVGTLEFSILIEVGEEYSANFSWCMMSGMLVLFTIAIAKLIKDTLETKKNLWSATRITIAWFFLILHVFCGISLLFETSL